MFQRPLPYLYLARQVFADAQRAVPGARRAAAGGGAVCRRGRSRVQRDRGRLHARRAGRAAAVAALRVRADGRALDARRTCTRSIATWSTRSTWATRRGCAALVRAARRAARARRSRPRPPPPASCARRCTRRRRRSRSTASWRSSRRASGSPAGGDEWLARHLRARGAVLAALQLLQRRARGARPGAALDRGALRRGAALDRRADVLAAPRRDRRHAARRQRGALRRRRRDPHRRPRRGGLAGAQHAQHLLSAVAARPARLAGRAGSLSGGAGPLPGSAAAAAPPGLALDLHARRRRDRVAVAAARGRRRRRAVRSSGWSCAPGAGPARACSCTRRWRSIRSRRRWSAARPARVAGAASSRALRRAAVPRPDRAARAPATYAVSQLERYLECPFKYFAAHVLKLPEERDEQAWMTPQERGHFVHEVFESFFARVAAARPRRDHDGQRRRGAGAVRRGRRAAPRDAAGRGSRARADAAARIGRGRRVRRARLRVRDRGRHPGRRAAARVRARRTRSRSPADGGPRQVALRSKADRIDLLADGTLRIVDYKTGRAPETQALAAAADLRRLRAAGARRPPRALVDGRRAPATSRSRRRRRSCELQNPAEGARRRAGACSSTVVDAIERGEFPVRPDEPFLCNWCPYPGVCRKDYVGDEIEK